MSDNAISKIEEKFGTDAKEIQEKINFILSNLSITGKLADMQIEVLSLRQVLVSRKRETSFYLNKIKKSGKLLRKQAYNYIKSNLEADKGSNNFFRVDYREVSANVERDNNVLNNALKVAHFQSQMQFYDDCMSTLTSIQFTIKNKMDFEKGFI